MNNVIGKEKTNIENMIYEVNGVQVIFDSKLSGTKCHDYHNETVTYYDIAKKFKIRKELKI